MTALDPSQPDEDGYRSKGSPVTDPPGTDRSRGPTTVTGGWAHFLDQLQYEDGGLEKPWDYWGTLTFKTELTERGTRRAIEAHLRRCHVDRAFWATEAGKVEGRLHGHCLYRFEPDLAGIPRARDVWRDWYQKMSGRAHIDQFEQAKGAMHYVSKYVTKQLADYDVILN